MSQEGEIGGRRWSALIEREARKEKERKKDSKEFLDKFFEGMTLFLWMLIILLTIVFVGQQLELWRL